jgi:Fe2+ or Zn2+ uptake regulation protein
MPTTAALDAELTAALRARGQRVTSQRLVIHRVVHELDAHVTAEQVLDAVADRLPGVALPTVYATLDLFEALGAVRRVVVAGGPARYDPRTSPHHHLHCRSCGAVEDVDAPVDLGPALAAAGQAGFDARHAEIVVTGRCRACARPTADRRAARPPRS